MTKRSPVSATRHASRVDEEAVRQAVISGMVDSDICKTEAFGNAAAIRELLSVQRQQWIDEMDGKLLSRTETAVHIARRVDWGNNRSRWAGSRCRRSPCILQRSKSVPGHLNLKLIPALDPPYQLLKLRP